MLRALGKEAFADDCFAEPSLPSTALGKSFTEYIVLFAECRGHSTKNLSPVVRAAVTATPAKSEGTTALEMSYMANSVPRLEL